jgi:hypothetical protein
MSQKPLREQHADKDAKKDWETECRAFHVLLPGLAPTLSISGGAQRRPLMLLFGGMATLGAG